MRTLERAGAWARAIPKSLRAGTATPRLSLFQRMSVCTEQLRPAPVLSPGSANCKAVLKCKGDLTHIPVYHSILTGDYMPERRGRQEERPEVKSQAGQKPDRSKAAIKRLRHKNRLNPGSKGCSEP
ncbi:hypothetical protein AAY473_032221 [Plecturocebus cupreus]